MERSNADWFKTATEYEALRQKTTVTSDQAETAKAQGREQFYTAFWGRYGLSGNPMDAQLDADEIAQEFDLTSMSVRDVIALAGDLLKSGLGQAQDMALLGFDFAQLSYVGDEAFRASPLNLINSSLGLSGRKDQTFNWIMEYEAQLRHLNENGGDAKAIQGTRNVLGQLRQLQTERNMYAAMGLDGRDDEKERVGLDQGFYGNGNLLSPTIMASLMDLK